MGVVTWGRGRCDRDEVSCFLDFLVVVGKRNKGKNDRAADSGRQETKGKRGERLLRVLLLLASTLTLAQWYFTLIYITLTLLYF